MRSHVKGRWRAENRGVGVVDAPTISMDVRDFLHVNLLPETIIRHRLAIMRGLREDGPVATFPHETRSGCWGELDPIG